MPDSCKKAGSISLFHRANDAEAELTRSRSEIEVQDRNRGIARFLKIEFGWIALLLFVSIVAPQTLRAQVRAYGEFTSNYLPDGPKVDFLYGGSTGILLDGVQLFRNVQLSADVQARFVTRAGEGLNSITVGPRLAFHPLFHKFVPFAEFNVGLARYHDNQTAATTDDIFGFQTGVTRRVSNRMDAVVDYGISRYGYNSGFYRPQTLSIGAVYHIVQR
jgi:hypothetical protein